MLCPPDTAILWEAAKDLPEQTALVKDLLVQLDTHGMRARNGMEVAVECKRVWEADLQYPILIGPEGHIWDGFHRLIKAWILGHDSIKYVQFDTSHPVKK